MTFFLVIFGNNPQTTKTHYFTVILKTPRAYYVLVKAKEVNFSIETSQTFFFPSLCFKHAEVLKSAILYMYIINKITWNTCC